MELFHEVCVDEKFSLFSLYNLQGKENFFGFPTSILLYINRILKNPNPLKFQQKRIDTKRIYQNKLQ